MTSNEAKELSHLLAKVGGLLEDSVGFVKDKDTDENFLAYRSAIATMMGGMFIGLMTPLYNRYPKLLPDYLDGQYAIPESVYHPRFYESDETNQTKSNQ